MSATSGPHRLSFHIVWISVALGALVMLALVLCASWMAREIDSAALNEQKAAVEASLQDMGRRIQLEQSTAANRTDGVIYSTHGHLSFVPRILTEWIGREFKHDRVYVYHLDGAVLQASAGGRQVASVIDPVDLAAVSNLSQQVAASLATPAGETELGEKCCYTIRRLEDGAVALVSVHPLDAYTSAEAFAGDPLLLASVIELNAGALASVSQRLGLPEIRVVTVSRSSAAVGLKDATGKTFAFLQWSPPAPAARLFQQVAVPGALAILLIGGSMISLLAWLRGTSVRLESSQAQASFLAVHDPLTGAVNRTLFEHRLREALHYRTLAETKVLLIALDLDRFKDVNDTYGHGGGDELLKEVGRRLLVELPEEATLGRLGGDEFAVIQPGVVSDGHARWICQRLQQVLSEPVVLSSGVLKPTVSMGYAVEAPSTISPEELARRADVALYASKAHGRNRNTQYQPSMDAERKERLALEVDLRNALLQNQFHLVYQPIFNAGDGVIAGAEALLRWEHPTRGPVSPELFISIAEEARLVDELGMWVMRHACLAAKDAGLPWISVNVSPVQFDRPALAEEILKTLSDVDFEPGRLVVEITEGVLLQSSARVQETLGQLRAAGVRVAIDDFGAGYASISYLRNYRIDKIKIDRSLIRQLGQDEELRHIVRAIIDMGKAMRLRITAEGVEEEAQRRELTAMGCTYLQGFLLSRPLAIEVLKERFLTGPSAHGKHTRRAGIA